MRKQTKKNPQPASAPAVPDFSLITQAKLLAYIKIAYNALHWLWCLEMALPGRDWAMLEQLDQQLDHMARAGKALKET